MMIDNENCTSYVIMRSGREHRRPLDQEIEMVMRRISDKLRETGWPELRESTLRMVAWRQIQLGKGMR